MVTTSSKSSSSSSTPLNLLLPCWFFSFDFMRLLQKALDFEDQDNNFRKDYSLIMADQENPKSTGLITSKDQEEEEEENKKDNNNNNNQESWLRLSLGRQGDEIDSDHLLDNKQRHQESGQSQTDHSMSRSRDSFLELNLFSGTGSNRRISSIGHEQELTRSLNTTTPLMFPVNSDEMLSSWGSNTASSRRGPFVSQSLMLPYFGRPSNPSNYSDLMAGPSSSFRVIDPPRRPNSGIWFVLQASQNQVREPFLPQIPKSFLRIKDGKMTVRLLMKYLVNKLRLEHESQVEIRCRGEELEPLLTLQHVRDTIWRGNRDINYSSTSSSTTSSSTLLQISSTSNHLMVLHYGRTLS